MNTTKKHLIWILLTGLLTGAAAILLTAKGNPANMGFCIACFIRDTAGALHLHNAAKVQYVRPEIVGLIVGACASALAAKEFRAKLGSGTVVRFFLGAMVMIGALTFLGCPLRMVIRMGSGDLNAFVGFGGFAVGIAVGVLFLKKGFNLGRAKETNKAVGFVLPVASVVLLALSLTVPALFLFSTEGPGSKHAPWLLAFAAALVVGVLAQRSRLCMVGGMRDAILFRDFHLLYGFAAIFCAVLLGNIILGNFKGFSFMNQPIAHSSHLWNALGMAVVGWGCTLLGGCPLRQLILAGEGNVDSAVTVLGMLGGAAVSHIFKLAGNADSVAEDGTYTVGGISDTGKIVIVCILAVLLVISVVGSMKKKEAKK